MPQVKWNWGSFLEFLPLFFLLTSATPHTHTHTHTRMHTHVHTHTHTSQIILSRMITVMYTQQIPLYIWGACVCVCVWGREMLFIYNLGKSRRWVWVYCGILSQYSWSEIKSANQIHRNEKLKPLPLISSLLIWLLWHYLLSLMPQKYLYHH